MFKKKNFLHRENLVRSRLTMFILVLFHLLVVSHLKANSNTGAPVTLTEDTITGTVTSPASQVLILIAVGVILILFVLN
jgi:hypothetical protein